MHKRNRNFRLLSGLIAILALTLGVGCRGFFVNPTLSTLTIGPTTPTFQQGSTLQMAATGTYNDGSTKDLTSSAFWSTSDSTIASINNTGLVTGVSVGTATITAASGTISGSTTVTISLANVTSIALLPTNSSTTQGSTVQFTATATTSDGKTHDITSSATWNSSNATAGTISSSGLFTAAPTVSPAQSTTISATSGNITGQTTLTVNP
jgi:Bacterial Ig-like domain (group 2)